MKRDREKERRQAAREPTKGINWKAEREKGKCRGRESTTRGEGGGGLDGEAR